jgi:hypothetical protein
MGGSALKSIILRRVDRQEFNILLPEIQEKLLTYFSKVEPLKFYHNKLDFGDLDLMVPSEEFKPDLNEFLKSLGANEIYKNDHTISFDYKLFQIDLIGTPKHNWETTAFYYSYNDINNLNGRIAHKFGLKFGHEGLHYPVREESGNLVSRIEISKDPEQIYKFLGLDYERYLKGFDEVSDIFDYVISSPYFNYKIFDYDQLNHTNRTRNRKRKNYAGFLEYLELNMIDKEYQFSKDKDVYLERIDQFFPNSNFLTTLNDIRKEFQRRRDLSEKFNGELVMGLTGLKGKELGEFIFKFKEDKDWFKYLEETSDILIQNDILNFKK